MDERHGSGFLCRLGHPAGGLTHQRFQIAFERADKIYDRICAFDAALYAAAIGGIAARKLHLAQIGQWFQLERLFRVAARNA